MLIQSHSEWISRFWYPQLMVCICSWFQTNPPVSGKKPRKLSEDICSEKWNYKGKQKLIPKDFLDFSHFFPPRSLSGCQKSVQKEKNNFVDLPPRCFRNDEANKCVILKDYYLPSWQPPPAIPNQMQLNWMVNTKLAWPSARPLLFIYIDQFFRFSFRSEKKLHVAKSQTKLFLSATK